jgi:hypothetical protein
VRVYTSQTIDALTRGLPLPDIKQTHWSPIGPGDIVKYLGRTTVVLGENRLHLYRFAHVQLISGPGTEGVGGTVDDDWDCGWVCTWAARGVPPNL